MIPMDMPPLIEGHSKLVQQMVRGGTLDDDFPIQCEPHSPLANDPGCKWPEPARKAWYWRVWDFIGEVFSNVD